MDGEFWRSRWQSGKTAFHRSEHHPLLERYVGRFPSGGRILVPLAGKTLDMRYLRARGHSVVGVELVEAAVEQFYAEAGWEAEISRTGAHPVYRAEEVELHVADMFHTTPGQLGRINGVYDRAALIALPPVMRARYAAHLAGLLPGHVGVLVITLEYNAREMQGPPFSVPVAEVEAIFGGPFEVFRLESNDALEAQPDLRERGLSKLREHALWLRRRP